MSSSRDRGSRDRALDIVCVGLGRAGGRLAGEFRRRGYPVLAFDTAKGEVDGPSGRKDLPSVPDEKRHFIGVDRHGGTGGDPAVGKQCVREHAARIRDLVRQEARDAGLILVCAGLGGGTGSAVETFVEAIGRDIAPVVVMATLPTEGENAGAKLNSARAVHELTKAEVDGLILIDNARIADLNADLPILEYFGKVNEMIVDPLDALNRLHTRTDVEAVSSFDGNRLRDLMATGGVLNYSATGLNSLEADEISNALLDSLYSSWLVASGLEPSTVSALAVIIEAPQAELAKTPVRVIEQLREQWKADTHGAVVDVAIYRSSDDSRGPTLRTLAACAALPARVQQLVEEAVSDVRAIRTKGTRPPVLDISALDDLDARPSMPRIRLNGPKSIPSTPASSASKSEAPRPSHSSPPPITKLPRGGVSENPPPPEEEEVPGRAAYARIVTRYKNTSNDELRKAIARRLERDRLSPHSQVRYHAVDAMAKIGVHIFESALLAATEDEDSTVRALASRAIEGHASRLTG